MQHSTYVLASRPAALDDFAGRVVEPAKLVLGVQLAEEADGTIRSAHAPQEEPSRSGEAWGAEPAA